MVQGPAGMAINNLNKPRTREPLSPHLSPLQHARTGWDSWGHYPAGFWELPLFASKHVCLIPQLFFLCPGYCQKRSHLSKSSKIQERESITCRLVTIQIYDLEYNWSLSIVYRSLYLALVSGIAHFPQQLFQNSGCILFTQQNSHFT